MTHPERIDAILAWMKRRADRGKIQSHCLCCWIVCAGLWPDHWSRGIAGAVPRPARRGEQMALALC
jgi:hypothetical protein